MHALTVKNLKKVFTKGLWPFTTPKTFTAVNDISFDLKRGEVLGFLGHNGAGKTTTIQMLLGTLTPTSGSITYFDKDFAHHRADILKKVSSASGYDKLPARLSIKENLDIVGRMYSMPAVYRKERIEKLLKFFDMWDMRDKETGSLSAGQATRVMLTKAFLPEPSVILLDEPTAALDPHSANEVRSFILERKNTDGVSILLTSHNMDEVTEVCDRVLVLKEGTIIADSTPEKLASSVSNTRIHVMVTHGKDQLIALLNSKHMLYKMHEYSIEIGIDEHAIANFLAEIAEHKILYSQISIDKPTLEDYFLHLAE